MSWSKKRPKSGASTTTMEYSEAVQSGQRKTLMDHLDSKQLSDVTFVIGPSQTPYNLNRVFLAMISPVFKAMLYGQMKESELDSEVIIEDMNPDVFQCIIHYAYCNDPQITSRNVLSVLCVCKKYHITKLQALCHEFVANDLKDNNFGQYYHDANRLGFQDEKVINIMSSYFSSHRKACLSGSNFSVFFEDVVQRNLSQFVVECEHHLDEANKQEIEEIMESKRFFNLSLKAMRLFLKRSLHCTEEAIWKYVIKWAEFKNKKTQKNRTKSRNDDDSKCDVDQGVDSKNASVCSLLKSVKDLMRFGLMDGRYFSTEVIPMNVLDKDEVIDVLRFFQYPEGGCGSFETEPRNLKAIIYKLKMNTLDRSRADSRILNTFECLQEYDLSRGCAGARGTNCITAAWSDWCYYQSDGGYGTHRESFRVNEIWGMDIGVPSWLTAEEMKFINDADIEAVTQQKGRTVVANLRDLKPGEIGRIILRYGGVKTNTLSITNRNSWNNSNRNIRLVVSHWKIYAKIEHR